MTEAAPMLHLLCGKPAAGKSTLAARLASPPGTIVLVEDDWLKPLFGEDMATLKDYVRCSARLRAAMVPHILALLRAGVSVVLDFPANTRAQRGWMRDLLAASGAEHQLHLLDTPDDVCLARLHARNAAGVHPFTVTDAQFHRIAAAFEPPAPDEGFEIVRHAADRGRA